MDGNQMDIQLFILKLSILDYSHCLTPESKVSSCFIIPVLPLRIS